MSTIAAISTAPGIGGIGIVRMSGEDCFEILNKIFKAKKPEKIDVNNIEIIIILKNYLANIAICCYYMGNKSFADSINCAMCLIQCCCPNNFLIFHKLF